MSSQHLQRQRRQHMCRGTTAALMVLLLAVSAAAQATQSPAQANKGKVAPAAASQAPPVGQQVGQLELQDLGECTGKDGLSSAIEKCQTSAVLTKPGQSHWYRFQVTEHDNAFSLHLLARVQNGRVRMGVWFPGQKLDEPPAMSPVMLLSSNFAQEQYITLPASQLYSLPGTYMLQIINEYGAPQYALSADVTSATTLVNEEDKKGIAQILEDCCPVTHGMVCSILKAGMDPSSADQDLCHQGAVQCDKQGRITDLVLQGTDMESDLSCPNFSRGFAMLPKLQRLDLAGAKLGADLKTIAATLKPAKELKWLVLRTAGVVGELSCDIILPSLSLLSLTRNGIMGPIPECFMQSTTLKHLYLSDNSLTGPLPEFSADSALQLFFVRNQVHDNKPSLTGPLPASLGAAANLQYLQLANNGLSGAVGNLPVNLKYLNISNNELEGGLPSLPTALVSVDISSNRLGGSLPADMGAYTNLVDLQAYYNVLEGELPRKLPPNMIQLAVTGNRLTGSVPPLPRGMKYLSLAENALEGPLPNGPGAAQLWFADLSSNMFSGPIPAVMSQSAQLVYLNVSNNQLSAIESAEAWSTPALMTLDASYNQIEGKLPAALATQETLAYLNLASNKLSGSMEAFAQALSAESMVGAVFDVSSNQLEGPIYNSLSNLAAFSSVPSLYPSWQSIGEDGYPLKIFNVGYNKLSGPFPGFLYSNLSSIMAQYCLSAEEGCHLWVAVNGGDNRLDCPTKVATHSGLLPEDIMHLARQNMGCVAADGTTYEISSVLTGKPVELKASATEKPMTRSETGKEIPPGMAAPEVKAAARQAAMDKAAGGGGSGPASWWAKARSKLPMGAIIGIAVACIVGLVLVGVLGFVFVYRRWWTVRAARSFQKMQEGPLAAAGGATINSSAPNAALDSLQAPQGVQRGDNVV